ncbi:MAG: 30S ribosomal protein S6 [bacterium]|nr:30S ribosomal protein S6 [bacterium]
MPKYELMYIVDGQIADNEVAAVTDEVKGYIVSGKATIEKNENLGKKKLAYPIKHQKFGNYAVVNFEAASDQVFDIEHKVRTNLAIVRYILLNMDEALRRMEKDRATQAKMKVRRPPEQKTVEAPKPKVAASGKKIQIDLDAEIEKALESEDLK